VYDFMIIIIIIIIIIGLYSTSLQAGSRLSTLDYKPGAY